MAQGATALKVIEALEPDRGSNPPWRVRRSGSGDRRRGLVRVGAFDVAGIDGRGDVVISRGGFDARVRVVRCRQQRGVQFRVGSARLRPAIDVISYHRRGAGAP